MKRKRAGNLISLLFRAMRLAKGGLRLNRTLGHLNLKRGCWGIKSLDRCVLDHYPSESNFCLYFGIAPPDIYYLTLRSSPLTSGIASGSNSSALLFNLMKMPHAASSTPAAILRFGTERSEVRILSPRPTISTTHGCQCWRPYLL